MTLRIRLVMFFCGTTMTMVLLTFFFGQRNVHHGMMSGMDFLLDAEAEEIEAILKAKGADKNSLLVYLAIHDHALLDAEVYYFSIHESNGKIVYESPEIEKSETHLPDLGTGRYKRTIHSSQLGELRLAEYPMGNLHIQIAKSMQELNQIQSQFNRTLVLTLPVVFIVILIISLGTSRFVFKPIQNIRKTAQRITVYNLSERIPEPSGRDELASLTHLLNEMFDRLENSFHQIKRFTADTSHELRTPLSLLQLHAEKLHSSIDLPRELQENAKELLTEANRMTEVVNRLLILTKVDAGIFDLKITRIDIKEFTQELFEDAQILAEAKG
ncbi:MAG: HAMP domain-containing protein, partial [Akkermansiaceae bacterium]|nr:HAMP domain-containing protein [Akkermansiaceae bacterium]